MASPQRPSRKKKSELSARDAFLIGALGACLANGRDAQRRERDRFIASIFDALRSKAWA